MIWAASWDALTGAGFQGCRTVLQVLTAVLNVLLNLVCIPLWSWRGAAWTSLASDGTFALSLFIVIWWILRNKDSQAGDASAIRNRRAEPQTIAEFESC